MRSASFAAAAGLLFATAALAQAPFTYTLLPPGGPSPAPRIDGTVVYDPAGDRLFLFGGSGGGDKNDLWIYSLAQRRWSEAEVNGDRPPARFGHTMVLDERRRRLLVFGGQSTGFFNDTWAYEMDRSRWTQIATGGAAPSRRYGHSAIVDTSRDRMIVSHGFTNSGRFDDTWALDLASGVWRDISPSSGRPLRRCLHHAVHDPGGDQMLLYGGCASGFGPCPLGDLWSFDLRTDRWSEITGGAKPAAREHYGVAFDTARNRMVLFGGSGAGLLNDTWEFDPRLRAWREVALSGPAPSARSRHQGAFASSRGSAYFFGGSTAADTTAELWMLGPGRPALPGPQLSRTGVVNAFSGAGGAVAPGELVSLFGAGLGPLEGVALGVDPLTGRPPVSGPGVTVTFNGVAAPLLFVSAAQINAQAPYEIAGAAEASIEVIVLGGGNAAVTTPVTAAKPGLFPTVFRPDGSAIDRNNPASPGSVVVLFATGHGSTASTVPASLSMGGQPAEVLFSGQAPGTVGVLQVNARVPEGLPPGDAAAVLRIGGVDSQAVSIPVR